MEKRFRWKKRVKICVWFSLLALLPLRQPPPLYPFLTPHLLCHLLFFFIPLSHFLFTRILRLNRLLLLPSSFFSIFIIASLLSVLLPPPPQLYIFLSRPVSSQLLRMGEHPCTCYHFLFSILGSKGRLFIVREFVFKRDYRKS